MKMFVQAMIDDLEEGLIETKDLLGNEDSCDL